jgi:nicotinamide mononucleotide transporter
MVSLWGYNLSYIEAVAVLSSLACIWLAAKEKVINFAFGLICTSLTAILVYQEQLYSSTILNITFFCFNIYGYFLWTRPKKGEENENNELKVRRCSNNMRIILFAIIVVGTLAWGVAVVRLQKLMPTIFEETNFPFIDSFVMVASIVAQLLMAQKRWENWALWIVIDIVAIFLYAFSGFAFMAILYAILVIIAIKGLYDWQKSYKNNI